MNYVQNFSATHLYELQLDAHYYFRLKLEKSYLQVPQPGNNMVFNDKRAKMTKYQAGQRTECDIV